MASGDIKPTSFWIPGIECGVITWPVKSYQVLKDIHRVIISPEFSIGNNSPFKWRFTISPHEEHPDRYLRINIRSGYNQRDSKDLGAQVNMTLNCSVTFGEKTFICAEEITLKFCSLGDLSELPNIDLHDCYKSCCPMDFVINCEIIIWFSTTLYPFEKQENLIALSQDIYSIFRGNKFTDKTLLLESGGKIKAHKSILSTRSDVFRTALESHGGPNLRISGIPETVMKQTLGFLYSGNFKSMQAGYIQSGVRKCAEKYGIPDLSKILQPSEINLNPLKEGESIECRWTFHNFSRLKNLKKFELQSIQFNSVSKNLSWCFMKLTLIKDHNEDNGIPYVELYCNGDNRKVQAYTRLTILTTKIDISQNFTYKIAPTFVSFGRISLKKLFEVDALPLPNDCITVYANVTLINSELKRERFVERKVLSCTTDVSGNCLLPKFSSDMENLLETGVHSDFKIIAEGKQFKTHRAIVANRDSCIKQIVRSVPASVRSVYLPHPAKEVEKTLYSIYTGRKKQTV